MASRAEREAARKRHNAVMHEQREAIAAAAVPPMEQLIHQAVANNSREIELTKRAETAEAGRRYAEASARKLQDDLIGEKTRHLETTMKLIKALEEINDLKDRNER